MKLKTLATLLLVLAGIPAANATQTIRELWDNYSKGPLAGKVSNFTSVGQDTNASWQASPPGNTSLTIDPGMDVWGYLGVDDNTLLPTSGTSGGAVAYYGGDGNMGTLTDPATSLPYGHYSSQCYATRALTTNAYINFKANGTYYFSMRMIKGISAWGWTGDNGGGFGFASSAATNADIVGVGLTRPAFLAADGVTDIGNAVYITTGTLQQPGIAGHPGDSGGPYYPQATGPANAITGAGVIVGQLTTTATGSSTLSVILIPPFGAIPSDPTTITWDATYSFTETNVMKQLVVWEYGTGPAILDAIRVGTTWGDAVGLEFIGPTTVSPKSTVYAGTTVSLSQLAALNDATYPMSLQWLSNSVPLTGATNSTLVLSNTVTTFTADYSEVASNYFGMITNTTHVTVLPAVKPFFTAQPDLVTPRYAGGSVNVTVGVDGTPPFGLQLKHAGTNVIPAVTSQLSSPGTATLSYGPIGLANLGSYTITVTNLFGSTNSAATVLTLLDPPGLYAAAVTALSPYGYWRLDDDGNTNSPAVIYDYFNGNNGVALDSTVKIPGTTNYVIPFGQAGVTNVGGFPVNHKAIGVTLGGTPSRLDLPKLPYFTNTMTFALWVKDGCDIMVRNVTNDAIAYGLQTASSTSDLLFEWGGGITVDTGLALTPNTWTFVALVVEPTQATVYMGNSASGLTSVVNGSLSISDSTTLGDTGSLTPLVLGRNPTFAVENSPVAGWSTLSCTMSDVAVIYQSLSASTVTNLFLAGVGLQTSGVPDGAGNLNLNWMPGLTLQEANAVTGPWTDVGGSPTPPQSVPILSANHQHFYRVRQ
jgi:hypothetical protein